MNRREKKVAPATPARVTEADGEAATRQGSNPPKFAKRATGVEPATVSLGTRGPVESGSGPVVHKLTASRSYGRVGGRCSCGRWKTSGGFSSIDVVRKAHAEHVRQEQLRAAARANGVFVCRDDDVREVQRGEKVHYFIQNVDGTSACGKPCFGPRSAPVVASNAPDRVTCPDCRATRWLDEGGRKSWDAMPGQTRCTACEGTGRGSFGPCVFCAGTGLVSPKPNGEKRLGIAAAADAAVAGLTDKEREVLDKHFKPDPAEVQQRAAESVRRQLKKLRLKPGEFSKWLCGKCNVMMPRLADCANCGARPPAVERAVRLALDLQAPAAPAAAELAPIHADYLPPGARDTVAALHNRALTAELELANVRLDLNERETQRHKLALALADALAELERERREAARVRDDLVEVIEQRDGYRYALENPPEPKDTLTAELPLKDGRS